MKANELRIGNLVKRESQPDGFYIDSQSFLKVELHPNWYEPIPLTEEWLIKFLPIVTYYEGGNEFSKIGSDYCVTNFYSQGFRFWISECDECSHYKELKYVSQLQNLYFALTGEELTIN